MMKKIVTILVLTLMTWFTLDITGFTLKEFVLVESPGFLSFDTFWWFLFLVISVRFLRDKKKVKSMMVLLVSWSIIQFLCHWKYTIFGVSQTKLEGYNNYFARTHHLISQSNEILIPDTYHMILHGLIVLTLVSLLVYKLSLMTAKAPPLKQSFTGRHYS